MVRSSRKLKKQRLIAHGLKATLYISALTAIILTLIKVDILRFGDNIARLLYILAFFAIASCALLGFRSIFLFLDEISIGSEIIITIIGFFSSLIGIITIPPFLSGKWSGVVVVSGIPMPIVLVPVIFLGLGVWLVYKGLKDILKKKVRR